MEPAFTRLLPLIQALTRALLPCLDKPFVFFGHSLGGLISFELTRLLYKDCGLSPVHLFVSARRAPQLPAPTLPIHASSEPIFLEELRRLNGTPKAVLENAELMQLLLPTLRADFAISETYVYTASTFLLDCPITAFGGLQDQYSNYDSLEAWREQTSGTFLVQMLPGTHFFLNSAQPLLLQLLSQELHRIAGR